MEFLISTLPFLSCEKFREVDSWHRKGYCFQFFALLFSFFPPQSADFTMLNSQAVVHSAHLHWADAKKISCKPSHLFWKRRKQSVNQNLMHNTLGNVQWKPHCKVRITVFSETWKNDMSENKEYSTCCQPRISWVPTDLVSQITKGSCVGMRRWCQPTWDKDWNKKDQRAIHSRVFRGKQKQGLCLIRVDN